MAVQSKDYAMPRLGRKYVDEITTADVLGCLVPIWSAKSETARRVRQRIGAVMQWAVAKGYREDNPAGDAIAAALPKNGGKRNHFRRRSRTTRLRRHWRLWGARAPGQGPSWRSSFWS